MSRCLCKKPELAVFPFVLLVQAVEYGMDDPVDAGGVDETDQGARAPAAAGLCDYYRRI